VPARGLGDGPELDDAADQRAEEQQVHEGDEAGGAAGAAHADEGHYGPGEGEDRDDEEG
jgi:hypothetical protein